MRTTLDLEQDFLLLAVFAILGRLCEAPGHRYWAEDISLLGILAPNAIITHAQITDVYLAGLALHKKGKLATFDRRIPIDAVRGGAQVLELVPV